MGCRRQVRSATALVVNLCGTDARGQAYIERTVTSNISRDGALLTGVRCRVRTGDTVVVRCAENTGRFRVIWQEMDGNGARRVGLARLRSWNRVEDLEAAEPEADDYQRPRSRVRRQHERYECEVAAELRIKHIQTPMWVTTVNLSEGGCSLNTLVSVPAMTELNIAMWLGTEKVWAQGVVVSSLYGLGTGIRFTGLSRQGREHLRMFLTRQSETVAERRGQGTPETLEILEPRESPQEVQEFTVSIPLLA
ncbi:MAG TPA: PilZ domain-containing protein [Terriglobales bacterium]|nr:PilZ domain-containing protein [Terriglobales bacterium]